MSISNEAMIEKEPITVLLSEKGWIRAMKGHIEDVSKIEFKQGDGFRKALHASTTDKLVVFCTNGKFFTLEANKLPGGRGHGEPVRLMVELEENHDIVEVFVHEPGRKLLVASTKGDGFVVPEDEVVAMTRKGKQVLNLTEPEEARMCVPVAPDADMRRHHRREPQAAGLPARRGQRDDARQGRAPAAVHGRRVVGRAGVRESRRPDLSRLQPDATSRWPSWRSSSVSGRRPARWRRRGSRSRTSSGLLSSKWGLRMRWPSGRSLRILRVTV